MDLALEEIYPFIKRVGTENYTKEMSGIIAVLQRCAHIFNFILMSSPAC